MIRNLKALGIAVVAVLALGAVAASYASAQQGTLISDGPVTLTGTNIAGGTNALSAFGLKTECPEVLYKGHKVNSTTELIPSGSTQTTITPEYKVCKTPVPLIGTFPTTVDMNSCDYTFDLKETTGGVAGTYGVTATLHCKTAGDHIKITIFTSGQPHTTANHFCTITITEKTDYIGLHATDEGKGDLRVHGTLEGITAHKETNSWDSNAFLCSKQTTETAKLEIDVTVTGDNAEKKPTTISLSHP